MNYPKAASKQELLAILDDMRASVEADDSFEGFVNYLMPTQGEPECDFMVVARWRVGNSMGQGGMSTFGEMEKPPGYEEIPG